MYNYVQHCTNVTVLWQGPPLCSQCHRVTVMYHRLVICTAWYIQVFVHVQCVVSVVDVY